MSQKIIVIIRHILHVSDNDSLRRNKFIIISQKMAHNVLKDTAIYFYL